MKKHITSNKSIIAISVIAIISLFSCNANYEGKGYAFAEEASKFKSDSIDILGSSAAIANTKDSSRVFMRNADIKFSVKDVRSATNNIEHIIRKHNGFITYTNLSGNKIKNNNIRITEDTVMNIYSLNMWNEITLRVPNSHLDSVLLEMEKLVNFLDSRVITADDVKLKLLSAQLTTKRNQKLITRLDKTIDTQGKKLKETVNGLTTLDNTQFIQDEEQLNLLDLKDKVSYSTVKLYVYQPEQIIYEKTASPLEIVPYKASFISKLGDACKTGWEILQAILLFFVAIWPFLVLFIIVWISAKWLIRTKLLARLFKI